MTAGERRDLWVSRICGLLVGFVAPCSFILGAFAGEIPWWRAIFLLVAFIGIGLFLLGVGVFSPPSDDGDYLGGC
jgi:uncharacterized membrane protein